jgi:hypothetical protein
MERLVKLRFVVDVVRVIAVSALLVPLGLMGATPALSDDRSLRVAAYFFAEAHRLCERDGGKLWRLSLDGPILFVDPINRQVFANQADSKNTLQERNGVFYGPLPSDLILGNTAVDWNGVRWTMLIWPLPDERYASAKLILHESFHRIQEQLGIPLSNAVNAHLETIEGRITLQLEWRALRRAIETIGIEREQAIRDALAFRRERFRRFRSAAVDETSLELGEGLAEYTGFKLGEMPRSILLEQLDEKIASAATLPSLSRSFAYVTGPLYGLLLDILNPDWRSRLKAGIALFDLLPVSDSSLSVALSGSIVNQRGPAYNATALIAFEQKRERERRQKTRLYQTRLIEGPVVVLPCPDGGSSSFNPNTVFPIDGDRVVYPTYRFLTTWGSLTAEEGVLSSNQGAIRTLQLAGPPHFNATQVTGPGWELKLKPGWGLRPGPRKGDYTLVLLPNGSR